MNENNGLWRFLRRPGAKKLLVFTVAALMCLLALDYFMSLTPAPREAGETAPERATGRPVSFRLVSPEAHRAKVTALGEVTPVWRTTVKAQVDGRVGFISDNLRVGNIVKAGEVMVRVEKSDYLMRVADARSRLATVRAALLREEKEADEARRNWKRSGITGSPASPLVLREPQLGVARANVDAAKAALAHAETQLGHTQIRAPFDGIVLKRMADPGESLFAGDEVAEICGLETAEAGIRLDAKQWALLPDDWRDTRVVLIDPEKNAVWDARVVRAGRHLDRDSRLRTLFLAVTKPLEHHPPLLPGTFVRAELTGREVADLLRIPEAALTKQGHVWHLDETDILRRFAADPVFFAGGDVYVRHPGNAPAPLRVALSPNTSYVNGLKAQPIPESAKE